jgi:hypothetical protein
MPKEEKELNNKLAEFVKKVDISSVILAFAIDLLQYFELPENMRRKILEKKSQNCSFEWTDVRRHVYFNHIFNEAKMHSKKSWQVRVVLHELRIRHYTGINEIVYCQVDIGGKKQQKTKETHIDDLIFENEVKCYMFGFIFMGKFLRHFNLISRYSMFK